MSRCVVTYEQADDGAWSAYTPDLAGVVALGTSRARRSLSLSTMLLPPTWTPTPTR